METEENDGNGQNQDHEIPCKVRDEVHFPESVETQRSTDQNRQHTTQKIIAVAAWATFLAVLAYTCASLDQLNQLRTQTTELFRQHETDNQNASMEAAQRFNQLKAAQSQATAARGSAEAISRQMRVDQRPWIKVDLGQENRNREAVVHPMKIGNPVSFPVRFMNTGKTPAEKTVAFVIISIIPNGEDPQLLIWPQPTGSHHRGMNHSFGATIRLGHIDSEFPKSRIIPQFGVVNGEPAPLPLSAQEFYALTSGHSYIVIDGIVRYSDRFGVKHWTTFCETARADQEDIGNDKCINYAADDRNY